MRMAEFIGETDTALLLPSATARSVATQCLPGEEPARLRCVLLQGAPASRIARRCERHRQRDTNDDDRSRRPTARHTA
jgi:hypothetical protein